MRMRVIRVVAALILLVSGLAAGVLTQGNPLQSDKAALASTNWDSYLEQCWPSGTPDSQRALDYSRGCLRTLVNDALRSGRIVEAEDAINRLAQSDTKFYSICHHAVHQLGGEIIDFYGNAMDAIRETNHIDCGNGISHGILFYWGESNPSVADFSEMASVCEEALLVRFGGCPEGIGHAAYQYQEPGAPNRFRNALKLCELFGKGVNQASCAYGVAMQPYVHQDDGIEEDPLPIPSWPVLFQSCKDNLDLVAAVIDGCIYGAGWLVGVDITNRYGIGPDGPIRTADDASYDRVSGLVEEGLRLCNYPGSVPYEFLCAQQIFNRLPLFWYNENRIEEMCDRMVERVGRKDGTLSVDVICIAGAFEFTPESTMRKIADRNPEVAELLQSRFSVLR